MSRYRNAALFLALAVLWGSAFTAIEVGLEYFPPVLFAAVRFDIAGVVMLAYAAATVDRWRPRTVGEWRLVGVGAVLMIAAYHAFLFIGQQGTTGAVAAIIVGLNPVLTTGFARLLLPGERLAPAGVLGLAIGLVGVAVLVDPDPAAPFAGDALSEVLVFLAVLSFALGSVLTRRGEARLPIETMEAWSMLGGALVMHAVSVGLGESVNAVRVTPTAVAAMGYLAVAASAVGFLIYFDLLDRLGAVEINLISYAVPGVAAVTGIVVIGERLTLPAVAGFALIFTGFLLIKRRAIAAELRAVRRSEA